MKPLVKKSKFSKSSKSTRSSARSVKSNEADEISERLDDLMEDKPRVPLAINLSKLKPAKLLKIKVNVGDKEMTSLIDTGADNNLIRKSVAKRMNLQINKNRKSNIVGFGLEQMTTLGTVYSKLSYYGIKEDMTSFSVVEDNVIKTDAVLGKKFCKRNKLIIDLSQNKISKVGTDNSRVDIYINEDQSMKKVIHESIIVRAAENVTVEGKITAVPIQVNYNCHTLQSEDNYL